MARVENDKLFDVIYMDVDGVLVDFRTPALRAWDCDVDPDSTPEYSMGKIVGVGGHEFWKRIDALGPSFWRNLPMYPWAEDLLGHCEAFADEVIFVTSPTWSEHSSAGKVLWFHDQFGRSFRNFMITPRKEFLATYPRSVLVDDSLPNVEKFRGKGGQAVLFPQIWNGHKRPEDPVKYVVSELEKLAQE